WQTNNIFNGLAAGSYNILIREAGLCISSNIPATITAGSGLTGTLTNTSTTCTGVTNGTITVTPTSGTAPYTIILDGTRTQTGNPTTTFTGVGTGAHSVTIRDVNGCTTTTALSTTIAAGTGYTANFTATATGCVGVNNGSLTITPQVPGTSPYTFVMNPGAVSHTGPANTVFNGLAPGTYSVVVTDAAGCQATINNMTVTQGAGLTATLTNTATTCTGVSNGTVTVTPTSGTSPYTIVMDGTRTQTGSPNTTFTGVGVGSHNITITDAAGCTTSAALTTSVTAGTGYTANFTAAATGCVGVNNGSLTITPQTPGTSPYTFVMSPGAVSQTGATNTVFNGLAPGTYSVVVTDAAGCQATVINMAVTQGAGLTATLTNTATTCAGVSNGSVTVTPTSGTSPYTIVMDGTRTQTGNPATTFAGVAAGSHSIIITDAAGCTTAAALTTSVTSGTGYTANFTAAATGCVGVNNGSLTITPQVPGTSPYSFVMNPGSVTQTGATNTVFNGLAPGTYSVVVTDAAGCQATINNMTVAQGAGLTATLTPSSTSCTGATNGSITVTPGTGTAPFTIVLDGTRTQTGNPATTFTAVASGSHSVTITDANGCVTSAPLTTTVAAGAGYTTTFAATGTSCVGVNNGSLTITPQVPGSSPYSFVMNPGSVTQTGAANTTFGNLSPGTYSVVVTDAAGCQSTVNSMTITQGSGLTANSTATPATCFGAANGTISVTPTNGSGPYTFVMNGTVTQTGAASTTFNNLAANTYSITITDAAGCIIPTPITKTITQPTALTAALPAALPVTCNGASNGTITVFPVGGTPPYNYSLDNVSFQTTNSFSVPQGTYVVYVKDANGCTLQFNNILITQPALLNATVTSTTNATCNGGSDGTIQVTPTGGTAPYQYSVPGSNYQTSNTLNVIAGTYSVTVKDANNCTFVIPNVVVGLTDNLTLATITPAAICEGTGTTLQLTTNATGFAWTYTGGPTLSSTSIGNPVASPTTTTTYTVAASLGNCRKTADVTVTVLPAPTADAGTRGDICFGQNFQLEGSGGVSYSWSPTTYLDNASIANPQVVRPDRTITYTLNVTDANNCKSLVGDNVTVNVTPPIQISASPVDTVVYAGAQFKMHVSSVATDYVWSPVTGLSNPYIAEPVVTAPGVGETVIYKVIASTSAGCQGEKFITVKVYEGPDIFVVTAFTPNGDGKNDNFIPFPVGIKQLNFFRVFNRWGQLMYSTTTLNQGWDGKLGGIEQQTGVYVWMVQGVTETGGIINKKGTVTLIR
ncbi:MAG: gliding motility-associated C-terminal domain-containing protein, partial [Chitinophagaceae bacterium]